MCSHKIQVQGVETSNYINEQFSSVNGIVKISSLSEECEIIKQILFGGVISINMSEKDSHYQSILMKIPTKHSLIIVKIEVFLSQLFRY